MVNKYFSICNINDSLVGRDRRNTYRVGRQIIITRPIFEEAPETPFENAQHGFDEGGTRAPKRAESAVLDGYELGALHLVFGLK